MLSPSSIIWAPSPLCAFIPTLENFGGFKNVISVLFVLLKIAYLEVEISRRVYFERFLMRRRKLDGINELSINSKFILPLQGEERIYLNLNLPTTTIVAQPFNVIKWQLKFNLVA